MHTGATNPQLNSLQRLASAFGRTTRELMLGAGCGFWSPRSASEASVVLWECTGPSPRRNRDSPALKVFSHPCLGVSTGQEKLASGFLML